MRKASPLIGLSLFALATTARAQEPAPAVPGAPAPATAEAPAVAPPVAVAASTSSPESPGRFQVGLAFLPMGLGRIKAKSGGETITGDSAFAMGVGLSAGYEVISGLSVGIAPQVIFKGGPKGRIEGSDREYDLMARVAYSVRIPDVVSVYAEVLPGYSILNPPGAVSTNKGLVVAFGVGAMMDVSKRVFANFGAGYQLGFQTFNATSSYSSNYVRVVLGSGVRF